MTRILATIVLRRLTAAPVRSAATVVLVACAAAILTAASGVVATAADAWDRAHATTRGGDVQVSSLRPFDVSPVHAAPGVAEVSGPFEARITNGTVDGEPVGITLWAMPPLDDIAVDQPHVVEGAWPSAQGEVALEQTFARTLGAEVGSRVVVPTGTGTRSLVVTGIAVTTRTPPYPVTAPGSAFVPSATPIAGVRGEPLWQASVRMSDDAARDAAHVVLAAIGSQGVAVTTSASVRADTLAALRPIQVVLASFGLLLTAGVLGLLAMQLGARLLDVARRVGQLRAAGVGTARLTAVFAAENALLAAVGAGVGSAAGALVSPRIASQVAAGLGTVRGGYSPTAAVVVVASLTGFFCAASALVALRWARASIGPAVRTAGQGPSRPSRLASAVLGRGGPPVAALAAKEAWANPMRTAVLAASIALAVMAGVAALAMEATFDVAAQRLGATGPSTPPMPELRVVGERADEAAMRTVVYLLEAALLAVALGTIGFAVATSVRERLREHAVLRAVGVLPGQLVAAAAASAGAIAATAAVVGVPLGFAFFRLAYGMADGAGDEIGWPSALQCLAVVMAACALATGTAVAAARLASGRAVASTLAS